MLNWLIIKSPNGHWCNLTVLKLKGSNREQVTAPRLAAKQYFFGFCFGIMAYFRVSYSTKRSRRCRRVESEQVTETLQVQESWQMETDITVILQQNPNPPIFNTGPRLQACKNLSSYCFNAQLPAGRRGNGAELRMPQRSRWRTD